MPRYAEWMTPPTTHSEPAPPPELSVALRDAWALDPAVTFLNHGSFGARPQAIVEAQRHWRERIEAQPIELLGRRCGELIGAAKQRVGRFLGMDPDGFGFVTNATEGVNTVLRTLHLEVGDELLTTSHVYNAVRNAMRHVAGIAGAHYVEADAPFPTRTGDDLLGVIEAALTDRTRLLIVDHISSPTALVFPVEQIIELCHSRGVDVLIDGAHAPGMLELDIEALGATYYTGNLHKWVCAPPGAAFLWVREDKRSRIHPGIISHYLGEGMAREFSWQGTRDITPWLCAADAVERLDPSGWAEVRRHNHLLATWAQAMLCRRWAVAPTTPLDGSLLGSMATVALPAGVSPDGTQDEVTQGFYDRFRIEVPFVQFAGRWWVRISAQAYNTPTDYECLADAMLELADD